MAVLREASGGARRDQRVPHLAATHGCQPESIASCGKAAGDEPLDVRFALSMTQEMKTGRWHWPISLVSMRTGRHGEERWGAASHKSSHRALPVMLSGHPGSDWRQPPTDAKIGRVRGSPVSNSAIPAPPRLICIESLD